MHRIGKGWGKTIAQQRLERKRRDVANIQQKRLIGSEATRGKENTKYEKQRESSGTGSA